MSTWCTVCLHSHLIETSVTKECPHLLLLLEQQNTPPRLSLTYLEILSYKSQRKPPHSPIVPKGSRKRNSIQHKKNMGIKTAEDTHTLYLEQPVLGGGGRTPSRRPPPPPITNHSTAKLRLLAGLLAFKERTPSAQNLHHSCTTRAHDQGRLDPSYETRTRLRQG